MITTSKEKSSEGINKGKILYLILYLFAGILICWSVQVIVFEETDWQRMGGVREMFITLLRYFPPDFSILPELIKPTIETFMIAVLGTSLAVILSIPVSLFAALNITPSIMFAYPLGRAIMTISRSIHEIVWALLFVAVLGLGALPGIMAIGMRSIGFLSKLTAETIEDIDIRPIEAIRSTGAGKIQVIRYAIIPQILPIYIGNLIFQWDINVRRASIMGIVGAGGLGLAFQRQMSNYNYAGVTTVILCIIIMVIIGEFVSAIIRKNII